MAYSTFERSITSTIDREQSQIGVIARVRPFVSTKLVVYGDLLNPRVIFGRARAKELNENKPVMIVLGATTIGLLMPA